MEQKNKPEENKSNKVARENNPAFKGLHTMLPADVKDELDALRMARKSVTGSSDYGAVIRELLWAHKTFCHINTRIDEFELILKDHICSDHTIKVEEPKKEKGNPSGLLGKHGEVDKHGKG